MPDSSGNFTIASPKLPRESADIRQIRAGVSDGLGGL